MNAIKEKRMMLEVLEELMETLDTQEKNVRMELGVVGKEETQARNWKTDELVWDDDEKTIPHYNNKYDYIPKQELSENDSTKLKAIEKIRATLEKMV